MTVGFGRPEASFNESDGRYRMCIVKDRETAQRVTVEVTDTPGTAGRNEGKHILLTHYCNFDFFLNNGQIIDLRG